MFLTRRARAAATFGAFCALNEDAAARAELSASGVSASRIAALYPDSEFAGIAVGFADHLRTINPAFLLLPATLEHCLAVLDGVVELMDAKVIERTALAELGEHPDDESRMVLGQLLDNHLRVPGAATSGTHYWPSYNSENYVSGLWWAWWLQTNRHLLPSKLRARADALMLEMGATFRL